MIAARASLGLSTPPADLAARGVERLLVEGGGMVYPQFLTQGFRRRTTDHAATSAAVRAKSPITAGLDDWTKQETRRLVKQCAKRSGGGSAPCTKKDCPLGTDPKRATKEFQKLVRPLIDKPARADVRAGAGGGDGRAVHHGPSRSRASPSLEAGKDDSLLKLRDSHHGRTADGVYPDSREATMTINCLDEERHPPKQETTLNRAWFQAAPFTGHGRPIKEARGGCEQWPVKPTLGYPYTTDIKGLADTPRVSVTPYEGGTNLAKALGGSLLTVEGE
ncbi:hypothetical protein ACIBI9_67035 [Nonomuraea sp. NPDC050451]|uniref:hypothetical protein n=1 Tax=Nonomuraea sp. NPDC050451 TaxID=3364364 RepID=UPI0037BDDF56